ncbi:N-acetylmuramoyl-L-alanine amidase [Photobacterium sp. OFAV2-7]|uniref:N-acetylmuramoyl-L-alanine amidase n=1 Tax=Photobacterium sp. OFAV2-7 TaxID=2917748 RepID=UPI001EF41FE1|nr:N-acetylmuramoyl-L-alanine amidase [Photobacterium sp. OFAV2-7]MCG7587530.1 N-acetylmuramoyl-L-alanine amidase [Photobacterium sp. OFAV2-7]
MRIAIVIGHQVDSPGAGNKEKGVFEFGFNEPLAHKIADKLAAYGHEPIVIYRKTYAALPADINRTEPDMIISLHCNAFNYETSGTTMLYYKPSKKGKVLAACLQESVTKALGLRDRGIVGKKTGRGKSLLKGTKAPAVIAEPFFIDNNKDLKAAYQHFEKLVDAYVEGAILAEKRFQNPLIRC